MNPQDFVNTWRGNTSTERQSYSEHFLGLCALVGHPTPKQADPEGKFFTLEAGATKQSGGQGWADVWYRGHFAIEYKGPHGDLDKAYDQLLQYRESLENPPLLIVGNTQKLVVHTNFTGTAKSVTTITLDDLLTPAGLQKLRNIFYNPEAFRPEKTTEQVTEEAAARFSRLAIHLAKWGYEPHDVAHYLIRLLFCLFAEDIQLLPRNLFERIVEAGRRDSRRFNAQVKALFRAMSVGEYFGEHEIPYFNGALFDEAKVLEMDGDGIAILHSIAQLDWSSMEPAIFGTLFTRSLDPSQRSKLGAEYTSKQDILLIVEPVLMAPLRRDWAEVQARAWELVARRDGAANRAVATKAQNDLSSLLQGFAQRLAEVRILDPACGSGNFLYVSLQLLLELWKEVAVFAGRVGLSMLSPLPGLAPSPLQLYGIEINDYAHELAQATVWIGYLQWLHGNGFGFPAEPILRKLDNIKHMDAILAYDAEGKPVEPEWPEADVIVGNPPFLGTNKMIRELGERYTVTLRGLYAGRVPQAADLVCYWFERARVEIERGRSRRAALIATQGIRGGANRRVLERIKQSGDIFWAWSDRDWVLEGAAVHISMIAFDAGQQREVVLDGVRVLSINPDLTAASDLTTAVRLVENAGVAFKGTAKVGAFDIDRATADRMLAAENPSGCFNGDVVRPWMNGNDVTGRPRDMWVVDFGASRSMDEAAQYLLPFEYVRVNVYPERSQNRRGRRAERWWLHGDPYFALRQALGPLTRFIGTPVTAKHRLFIWISAPTLPDQQIIVFAREDDYFFGVLHSCPHELWTLRLGTSLEDRPRYTPTSTFETFPFPWPPGREPQDDPRVQAIAAAARVLVEQRDAWLNPPGLSEKELQKRTLTNLYNERPGWLEDAHKKLDEAVFDAYGWPHDLGDEQILERLLVLNLARAGAG